MLDDKLRKKIFKHSISLEKYGINNLAWRVKDALSLVNSLKQDRIGIFGGDVYELYSDHLKPLYENWASEPNVGETELQWFERSKMESIDYIRSTRFSSCDNIVISIVFSEKII